MAKAFELFIKKLHDHCGRPAWELAGSYDCDIIRPDRTGRGVSADASVDAAGRRYRASVQVLRDGMRKSFLPEREYRTVQELVIDRTEAGSPISEALVQDGMRTNEELRAIDESNAGWGSESDLSPWRISALGFCFDSEFRDDFANALKEDQFQNDVRPLWAGIDRIADSPDIAESGFFDDADRHRAEVAELLRRERQIVESMLLASLFGPADFSQFLGYELERTPPIKFGSEKGRDSYSVSNSIRLVPIIPVGQRPWEYVTGSGPSFDVPAGGRARIGKYGPWCVSGSSVGITLSLEHASARHCEILYRDEGWVLRDVGSTNKTMVIRPSGDKIVLFDSEAAIHLGDVLCVLPCETKSEYGEESYHWMLGPDSGCYRVEVR